jgi:hypothetical protein
MAGVTTLSISAFSIMTLSVATKNAILSIVAVDTVMLIAFMQCCLD